MPRLLRWPGAVTLILTLTLAATPLHGRPHPTELPAGSDQVAPFGLVTPDEILSEIGSNSSSSPDLDAAPDTIWFGGTTWDAGDNRWEAIEDSTWTFETGVGSSINTDPAIKSVGLHRTMEGWVGLDLNDSPDDQFRRSGTCAIAGGFSMWAGLTAAEAAGLSWAAGQGYGNGWDIAIQKSFTYPGSGTVTLHYDFAIDSEPGFDFLFVEIDLTGSGSGPWVQLDLYDGLQGGTVNRPLASGSEMRTTAGPVTIRFRAFSDGSYSDEDGLDASTCGHSTLDNIRLGGAIADTADFEADTNGWATTQPRPLFGGGDVSDLVSLNALPLPAVPCGADFGDTVLVFADPNVPGDAFGGHDPNQDNIVLSPWIDLAAAGIKNRRTVILEFRGYFNLSLANAIFVRLAAQPDVERDPLTGNLIPGRLHQAGSLYQVSETAICLDGACRFRLDISNLVSPEATAFRVAVGATHACFNSWGCNATSNSTPWLDNIRVGVPGGTILTVDAIDRPRDAFPEHPGLDADDPARFDSNRMIPSNSASARALGDSLVVTGALASEVRTVFRLTRGPLIDNDGADNWLARFQNEGGGWYSARMDTAERGGVQGTGSRRWMTAFHESDPAFTGTDTSKDPGDLDPKGHPSRLLNDMFPDGLFTPGTRIDLFYKARTGPLAPWRLEPDTSQAWFIEMEVLPSSTDGAGNQNRVLFVNMAPPAERDVITRDIEAGLSVALPGGSPNAENTAWDRFDLPDLSGTPRGVTTDFANLDEFRVTERVLAGYDQLFWNNASGVIQQADARLLLDWLTCYTGGDQCDFGCGRGLYLAGDNLASSMASGDARQLLNRCGVGAVCGSYRLANCPAGTPADQASCVPVESSGLGAHFDGGFAGSLVAPSPTSPQVPCMAAGGSFDVLTHSSADAMPAPNLVFNGAKGLVHDASVSAIHWYPVGGFCFPTGEIGGYHKSVVEGYSLHRLRTPGCGSLAAIGDRLTKVTTWFNLSETYTSGVPGPGEAPPGAVALLPAAPNPMKRGAGARLTMELPGPLSSRLTIHDLSGRLVRVLHDGPAPVGQSGYVWDGLDATGAPVPSGMYFARLGAGGKSVSTRIVVTN